MVHDNVAGEMGYGGQSVAHHYGDFAMIDLALCIALSKVQD